MNRREVHASRAAADKAWSATCKALDKWVQSKGRLPLRKADAARERMLATWLSTCQQKHKSGWFTAAQLRVLRAVPGMKAKIKTWDAVEQVSVETRFNVRVVALQRWVKKHAGALPKRNSADADERNIATWLGSLQQKRHHPAVYGALSPQQLAALRKVPGMKDRILQWDGVLMLKDAEPEPSTPEAGQGIAPAASTQKKPKKRPARVAGRSNSSASKRACLGSTASADVAEPAAHSDSGRTVSSRSSVDGVDKSFKVGSHVSIWSSSQEKWFDDGRVTKVTTDGLDVTFNERSLEKLVLWSLVPSRVRLRVLEVGARVSVWSVNRHEWVHDGVVVNVGPEDVKIVGDGGQMESCVPLRLTSEFVMSHSEVDAKQNAKPPPGAKPVGAELPIRSAACSKRLQAANAKWQKEYGPPSAEGAGAEDAAATSKPCVTFADGLLAEARRRCPTSPSIT